MTRTGLILFALSLASATAGADGPAHRVTSRNAAPQPGAVQVSTTSLAAGNVYFDGTSSTGAGLYSWDAGSGRSTLVAEVYAGPTVELAGRVYFVGSRSGDAAALWTTDGTAAGTRQIREIGASSNTITVAGGRLYLLGAYGTLWSSDGTEAGTLELPAAVAMGPELPEMIPFGGRLLFLATDSVSNRIGLWESRGTAATTVQVADLGELVDTREGYSRSPYGLASAGGRVVFFIPEGLTFQMWASDGTTAGTVALRDFVADGGGLCPGYCYPLGPSRPVDGLFFGNDGVHGREPWRTNGTSAGTRLVRDIAPGPPGSDSNAASYGTPGFISPAVGGFQLLAADDGVHGRELWRTDSTEAGTSLVADITPGPSGSDVFSLAAAGGYFFFAAAGELWRSDGTATGTQTFGGLQGLPSALGSDVSIAGTDGLWKSDGASLELIDDGARPPGLPVSYLTAAAGRVFFTDPDRRTLWVSDGTDSGTAHLGDFSSVGPLWSAGRRVYFSPEEHSTGTDPWSSDGSAAGTIPVAGFEGGGAADFTAVGGRVFYSAADDAHGFELWTLDGGTESPRLVADLEPGFASSSPSHLTVFGRSLVFTREDNVGGLWRSDGTTAGTTKFFAARVDQIAAGADRLWFTGYDTVSYGLWITDATPGGTVKLASNPGSVWLMTPAGRRLFYFVGGGAFPELWTSDGTPQGTHSIRAFKELYGIAAGPGGTAFIAANDGVHGRELWHSDGTADGTALVRDILPGTGSSEPQSLLAVDGLLLFTALDGENGRELWRSDGTADGTFLLQDLAPGLASSAPQGLTLAGNAVYFQATDDAGAQLWALPLEALRASTPPHGGPRVAPPRD